jgi:hypothetical protein
VRADRLCVQTRRHDPRQRARRRVRARRRGGGVVAAPACSTGR